MKVKNIYLLFVILFCPILSFGQLNGKYCWDVGFENISIIFKPSQQFYYSHAGCLGAQYGKGTYQTIDSLLVLTFETTEGNQKNMVVTSKENQSDTISITVNLTDETNAVLGGGLIFVKDSNETYISQVTDDAGNCVIKLKKSENKMDVRIKYIGYREFSYSIVPNKDYVLKINLEDAYATQLHGGEVMTFTIKNLYRRRFDLLYHNVNDAYDRTFIKNCKKNRR